MDKKNIEILYKRANSEIDSLQLSKALTDINKMIDLVGLSKYKDKLNHISETYKYMVHYLIEGSADQNRNRLLSDIIEQLKFISDAAIRESTSIDDSRYYYATLRFNKLRNEHISSILDEYGKISSEMDLADAVGTDSKELRKIREDVLQRLFVILFTSFGEDKEYKDLLNYLKSGYADYNIMVQSVSAMTLGLLSYYDKGKFETLLDIYENSTAQGVRARALVGIVLTMASYRDRIENNVELIERLSLWNDSIEIYHELRQTIRSIIGTLDTERITSKMKDEVIPELMKLRPDMLKSIRENQDMDINNVEDNPEWEDLLKKNGLDKKLHELSELQNDGADLMMVTFSNLKQFPFFHSAANWFLPFDSSNTSLDLKDDMKKFVDLICGASSVVCDSDLFSLALAANQMPEAQRNIITNQLNAHFEQLKELSNSGNSIGTSEFDIESLKSVRDLYRFFKLFKKHSDFSNPFDNPLEFYSLPVIKDIVGDSDSLRVFAEFFFKRKYYKQALPLLKILSSETPEDAVIWEKIGYCYQFANDYNAAFDAYNRASLLKDPSMWLLKRMAYISQRLGNYKEAAEYYSKALEMDPDNISLIMNRGNMLLETGETMSALTDFYHANYLQKDTPGILRAIAWSEFLNGNYAKCSEYIAKILTLEPMPTDYLNAGHCSFMQSNFKEARNYYKLASHADETAFQLAIESDITILKGLGADITTLRLVLDF